MSYTRAPQTHARLDAVVARSQAARDSPSIEIAIESNNRAVTDLVPNYWEIVANMASSENKGPTCDP